MISILVNVLFFVVYTVLQGKWEPLLLDASSASLASIQIKLFLNPQDWATTMFIGLPYLSKDIMGLDTRGEGEGEVVEEGVKQ